MGRYNYERRPSLRVAVGNTAIGGTEPIRVQSMTNTPTLDTEASVAQACRIAEAGADLVRLTAQGVQHARNLGNIRRELRARGVETPLVADIHFNATAAFAAAEEVEKVRINPGNFVDPGRTFKKLSYTEEEYAAEIEKIREKLVPFLELCREHGTAIRLGVNHGSLSDRIMSRYGDTPAGMVESVMEYLRICREVGFNDIVISIKASNVVVMTETVRLLAATMKDEGMNYPLHLGVTEAGDGEDGRVKSAVGIGSLLADGLGDTIRVSLSEAPEAELPVARELVAHISRIASAPEITGAVDRCPHKYGERRMSEAVGAIGGDNVPAVEGVDFRGDELGEGIIVVSSDHDNRIGDIRAQIDAIEPEDKRPVVIRLRYPETMSAEETSLAAATDFGALLLEGYRDGIWLETPSLTEEEARSLAMTILQATRTRITKTEFIACPGCGRTLFDLQSVLAKIKAACSHLTGLKIGVMGCIVNGPGEMADADYGYVGAAAGNVSLYKGKECVMKNIPADEALPRLIELIKANGDWKDA
ncbi:MAG: (E)-4-hydroxy-3-methylbut-2-enyl-diphosphate synthase [Muribaculaceae bacterium]|nr:(E)-4-hydroxy-3-methylbut-2-enyl-diphosphate synthase [Muribaculaceae bacterium]